MAWKSTNVKPRKTLLVAFILLLSALTTIPAVSKASEGASSYRCTVLYFFNGIVVYNSTINETLILETPRNISMAEFFDQKVYHMINYNLEYNETSGAFVFNVTENGYFEGFFVSRLEICAKFTPQNLVRVALETPYSEELVEEGSIPENVLRDFVKTPHNRVVSSVKPAYELWFKMTYRRDVTSARLTGIAVTAGYFVQGIYIRYEAGSVPRTIDEVVDTRRGDCDDMSRIIVELLNAYGIPATMYHGYVFIKNFNYTIPVENVTYLFINNGPHAFPAAYIPSFGWISLDFLAGSLILYPFVFEGYTRETEVNKQEVERFLDLHRAINATQVMAVLDEEDVRRFIGYPVTLENALRFFTVVLKGIKEGMETSVLTPETTPTETLTNTMVTEEELVETTRTPLHGTQQQFIELKTLATVVASAIILVVAVITVVYVVKRKAGSF